MFPLLLCPLDKRDRDAGAGCLWRGTTAVRVCAVIIPTYKLDEARPSRAGRAGNQVQPAKPLDFHETTQRRSYISQQSDSHCRPCGS
jgi:hypothetical protein